MLNRLYLSGTQFYWCDSVAEPLAFCTTVRSRGGCDPKILLLSFISANQAALVKPSIHSRAYRKQVIELLFESLDHGTQDICPDLLNQPPLKAFHWVLHPNTFARRGMNFLRLLNSLSSFFAEQDERADVWLHILFFSWKLLPTTEPKTAMLLASRTMFIGMLSLFFSITFILSFMSSRNAETLGWHRVTRSFSAFIWLTFVRALYKRLPIKQSNI